MGTKLRSRWPLFFSIVLLLCVASYCFYLQLIYPVNRSFFIVGYGVICLASVIFLTLYMLRKRSHHHMLGSRQSWLHAHNYVGIISIVALFMHLDFRPTGTFNIFLATLFLFNVLSGVVGAFIYLYVPLSLTKYGRTVIPEEEIKTSIDDYLKEADNLIAGTSEELKGIYSKRLRPLLRSKKMRWEYLLMTERELLGRRRDMIESCRRVLPGQDMHDLLVLGSILTDKEKLSFMHAKLKSQRSWLALHMPLTLALLVATAIHVLTIIYY